MIRLGRRTVVTAVASIAVLATVGMSACAGGGGTPVQSPGIGITGDDVAAAGDVTITVADYLSGSQLTALQDNITAFEAAYPNITITTQEKDFSSYGNTIALTMSSDTAPDIAQSNSAMAPRLVSGSLVRSMNDYYDAYGWADTYPSGVNNGLKLASDGKGFGQGDYYGMALGGNMVFLYYNKALLESWGLEPPTTFDDFVAAMGVAKDNGVLPLSLGNLEQYSGSWTANTVVAHFVDIDATNQWSSGTPDSTIDNENVLEGFKTLQDWVDAGYISENVNGTKDDDASNAFADGDAAFMMAGSWRAAQFDEALGEDGGAMLLPDDEGGQTRANGFYSEAWTISTKSAHPDIAAFVLDYLYGPDSLPNNLAGGYLPFAPGAKPEGGPIAQDTVAAWYDATSANGLMAYLDNATPSMGNTYFPGLQSLLGGQETPGDLASSMQDDWTTYYAQ